MEFVMVAKAGDIPENGMKGFVVKGKKLLLANIDGDVCALSAVCTHLGGPLDKGQLDGKTIKCPWHASVFDATTGKAVGGPAKKDLEKYEVKVEDGEVFVGV
jgi:nitrite reductase/ring-hydroxylating ferredoxin subunit